MPHRDSSRCPAARACYPIRLFTLRSAAPEDDSFLFELFQAVRGGEFAQWGLPTCQLGPLLRMQFQAQAGSYRANYPSSDHSIVLVDGERAGRIWIDRGPARYVLVDISLLPAFQNRAIGTALVSDLVAQARAAAVPVECHVALNNPGSLRFHQRLGFTITGQDQMYLRLECRP